MSCDMSGNVYKSQVRVPAPEVGSRIQLYTIPFLSSLASQMFSHSRKNPSGVKSGVRKTETAGVIERLVTFDRVGVDKRSCDLNT
jgi:hypothetical protein